LSIQLLVIGLAGSGKSTVGRAVAEKLGVRYVDGDQLHPQANLQKMAKGTPLSDDDRDLWVANIIDELGKGDVVIGASLLKRSYRDQIKKSVRLARFAQLDAPKSVLEERLANQETAIRKDLLTSQLAIADPIAPNEDGKQFSGLLPVEQLVSLISTDVRAWLAG
jgi:carbohydrate kinase (thermoresistant glucokinase family)